MDSFCVDIDELKSLSFAIRNLSSKADSTASEIDTVMKTLPYGWEGDAAVSYINQFDALHVLLKKSIDSFEDISKCLDNLCDSFLKDEDIRWLR